MRNITKYYEWLNEYTIQGKYINRIEIIIFKNNVSICEGKNSHRSKSIVLLFKPDLDL